MPKLPRVSGKELLQALQVEGFQVLRVRGSHHYLRQSDTAALIVVPIHGNRTLPIGTLSAILKQAGLTTEDLIRLLER